MRKIPSNTFTSLYQRALNENGFQADDAQRTAVSRLEEVYQEMSQPQSLPQESITLRQYWRQFLGKQKPTRPTASVKGLYMWGGVGRGKTWLLDLFFQALPSERKLRLHFHHFMLRVHQELAELQGNENPLEIVADRFKIQTDVLCFDEFFVSDITDAMLLATTLEALFARGITLVATSNIPPDNLYHNGLQRARFLPAITLIKQYCDVIKIDAGIDYRLSTLTQTGLYLTPLNQQTENTITQMFIKLAGTEGESAPVLQINCRALVTIRVAKEILAVDFHVLCEQARSHLDYIVLAKQYNTVLLHNVRSMGIDYPSGADESTARRFLALIDEFYERKVKLIISAQVPMAELYRGEQLKFEYQRCLSRLQEMQSKTYLQLLHLP